MGLFPAVSRLIRENPRFPYSVVAVFVCMSMDPELRLVLPNHGLKVRHEASSQKRPVKFGIALWGRRVVGHHNSGPVKRGRKFRVDPVPLFVKQLQDFCRRDSLDFSEVLDPFPAFFHDERVLSVEVRPQGRPDETNTLYNDAFPVQKMNVGQVVQRMSEEALRPLEALSIVFVVSQHIDHRDRTQGEPFCQHSGIVHNVSRQNKKVAGEEPLKHVGGLTGGEFRKPFVGFEVKIRGNVDSHERPTFLLQISISLPLSKLLLAQLVSIICEDHLTIFNASKFLYNATF